MACVWISGSDQYCKLTLIDDNSEVYHWMLLYLDLYKDKLQQKPVDSILFTLKYRLIYAPSFCASFSIFSPVH